MQKTENNGVVGNHFQKRVKDDVLFFERSDAVAERLRQGGSPVDVQKEGLQLISRSENVLIDLSSLPLFWNSFWPKSLVK